MLRSVRSEMFVHLEGLNVNLGLAPLERNPFSRSILQTCRSYRSKERIRVTRPGLNRILDTTILP